MKKNGIRLGIVVVIVALIYGFSARGTNGNVGIVENAEASLSLPVKQGSTGIVG